MLALMVAVRTICALAVTAALATPAWAQRAGENAVTSADDAFGTSVGNEQIGLYSSDEVRGFSPGAAGNIRIDGLYLGGLFIGNPRLLAGTSIKVGLTAQGYPFPAPTGIVELSLRPAGTKPLLSAVLHGGFQDGFELDGQLPVSSDISLAGGVGFSHFIDNPGGDYGDYWSVGLAPAWRPNKDTEIRAFYALELGPKDVSTPFIFVDGPHLPPRIPHRFQGQHWAAWHNRTDTMGLFGHTALGVGWSLKGGLFRQRLESKKSFNTLFVDTAPDGAAHFVVAIHPVRTTTQNAGEVRLTRQLDEGPRRHELHLSVKGRTRTGDFGGEQVVDFGPVTVGKIPPQFPKPDVEFGEETSDKTRQWTGGIAYRGIWPGVGELGLGIQKTDYRKTISPPDSPAIVTRARPVLWNATLAVNLFPGLVAYGGYTRGLEDSGVAPEIAVNRSEAPPALITSQKDIGLRYAFGPMRLVVGGFEVNKPYFNLDPSLVFRDLGTVRHRGLEISLSGEPVKGLNVVAGAVLMKPRVSGPAVDLGLIGSKPVGQAETMVTGYADYRLPFAPAFSVNLGVNYLGRRPGSPDNLLTVPARTIVDLGGRYRFKLGRSPATLRLQVSNLLDQYAWDVSDFGGFKRNRPRSVQADLSADF
jgi:iron complex outermembrane recepter protein